MTAYFFWGTLRHSELRAAVLGRDARAVEATLPDHRTVMSPKGAGPSLEPSAGARSAGVLVAGVTPQEETRLAYYAAGLTATALTVATAEGPIEARVFVGPSPDRAVPWDYAAWAARWGRIAAGAAGDLMRGMDERPAAAQFARRAMMMVRADSRLRAQASPGRLRGQAPADAVRVEDHRQPYANYFATEEYDLSFRRFDGSFSPVVNRAVFVSGDAATVLPYDPVRDRVLLVEQFRAGPFARGDLQPWLLEPVAGRIDAGETPESTVRREAEEEAGLSIGALHAVAHYYSSPGGVAEYVYAFVGIADLPDGVTRVAGLDSEAEDIRGHLLGFDDLMRLVDSGEGMNAPLVISAWWLAANRARLVAEARQP